jgi:enoyl-CoA hydratase/carnithine racemase
MDKTRDEDVTVTVGNDYVATVELRRPPDNYFDEALIEQLHDALQRLDDDEGCRVSVLCSEGKNFCAGARVGGLPGQRASGINNRSLYERAALLLERRKPMVAAVQGTAVGGGLGLTLIADFRVASPSSRFSANFSRLGYHQGFGISVTLPHVVGMQGAMDLLYTGRRVPGDEAHRMGLVDRLVALGDLRDAAHDLAAEIARSAPLAVQSIRATLGAQLVREFREAIPREVSEQDRLRGTRDFREGTEAMSQRRPPVFEGN